MKKTIFPFFIFFMGVMGLYASSDMKVLEEVAALKTNLKKETAKINTIQSDFKQIKHLAVFDEDIVSSGKFYYQKEDKLSLQYTHPIQYTMVMNGGKIKIASDGKENVYDIANNKSMKEMREILSACMTGDLELISDNYKMEYFHNDKEYLIKVFPTKKEVRDIMQEINIYLDKKDLSVIRFRMYESGSDAEQNYTEYHFNNKKINTKIPEEQFAVK